MDTTTAQGFTEVERRVNDLQERLRRRGRELEEMARVELDRVAGLAGLIGLMEESVTGGILTGRLEGGVLRSLLRRLLENVTDALRLYDKSRDVVGLLPDGAAALDRFVSEASCFKKHLEDLVAWADPGPPIDLSKLPQPIVAPAGMAPGSTSLEDFTAKKE